MSNKIIHAVTIHSKRQNIYEAITTQKGLSGWWTTDVKAEAVEDSVINFRFHGPFNPDMKITSLQEDEKVKWECVGGAEQWLGSTFTFDLTGKDGSVVLQFTQVYQKQISDLDYGVYNFNWAYYLQSLKELCETGNGKPFDKDRL